MKRFLILLSLLPGVVQAQATSHVNGTVRDAEGRPLFGAIVTLSTPASETITRTNEDGTFTFRDVTVGNYAISVRRLGYDPLRQGIDVVVRMPPLGIELTRLATLDTVRVRSNVQAIYGTVGHAKEMTPLPGATVQVIGVSSKITVDSNARFFVPIKNEGAYVVRIQAEGFAPQMVSVTVPKNGGIELAPLLERSPGQQSVMMDVALIDFNERARYRHPQRSAVLSHSDLMRQGNVAMLEAVRSSETVIKRGLRFSELVCVLVDGNPRPSVALNSFQPRDVEAIEVYAADPQGALTKRWPKSAPCGESGMPRGTPTSGVSANIVQFVVLWMRK